MTAVADVIAALERRKDEIDELITTLRRADVQLTEPLYTPAGRTDGGHDGGRALWVAGKSPTEIATVEGVSDAAIYWRAKKNNWPPRPKRKTLPMAVRCSACQLVTSVDPCSRCGATPVKP